MRSSAIPSEKIPEALAVTWEYNRCVVPEYTNWDRYIALARLGGIAIVAEYNGALLDVVNDPCPLGYDIDEQLDILFGGTSMREPMGREYRASLLFMTEKASNRRGSRLYQRYAEALAHSPADYFRIRDCDGMFRFYLNAAIACNDSENWLSEPEYRALMEVAATLYDSVAFHKHRAEGEICNVFAYADPQLRQDAYRANREVLWALDANWSHRPDRRAAVQFCRFVGGPIHLMMRRYRFVEDGLMAGRPETQAVIDEARKNFKLWYRSDPRTAEDFEERYTQVMTLQDRLLFDGFAEMLERPDEEKCPDCIRKEFYGTAELGEFSGVGLCPACRERWGDHLRTIADRAGAVLPLSPPR